jgi:hypothetical protein
MDSSPWQYGYVVSFSSISIMLFGTTFTSLLRLGKPEALTAVGIVTKEYASYFIPFNETTRRPEGSSCGMGASPTIMVVLNGMYQGGVETFQADYGFVALSEGKQPSHFPPTRLTQIGVQLHTDTLEVYWNML